MDGVLLTVLRHWPNQGPSLFGRMAERLTGDEFIQFMSGKASWRIRAEGNYGNAEVTIHPWSIKVHFQ